MHQESTTDAFDAFVARRHFASLDGLRALSIAGVVWHHAARGQALRLAEAGAHGVALFFAISGFLITTLLLRERDRTGDIALKHFYARRALRIMPLYAAVLLVYVVVVFVHERHTDDGAEFFANLKYFATYTSNWFVHRDDRVIFYFAWSLATEEQFYIVWPSIERLLGRRLRHAPAGIALVVVLVWALVEHGVVPLAHSGVSYTLLHSVAPAILLGAALAHALHERGSFMLWWRLLGARMASPLLLLLVVITLLLDVPVLIPHALMVLLVGACVLREDHALAPLLSTRVLVRVGTVSYGIYLLHMLVLNVVERVLMRMGIDSRVVVFGVTLICAFAAALLSYRTFESPFLRLKPRFRITEYNGSGRS